MKKISAALIALALLSGTAFANNKDISWHFDLNTLPSNVQRLMINFAGNFHHALYFKSSQDIKANENVKLSEGAVPVEITDSQISGSVTGGYPLLNTYLGESSILPPKDGPLCDLNRHYNEPGIYAIHFTTEPLYIKGISKQMGYWLHCTIDHSS